MSSGSADRIHTEGARAMTPKERGELRERADKWEAEKLRKQVAMMGKRKER